MDQISRRRRDLNHFDPTLRAKALRELVSLAQQGTITLPPKAELVNMHCHTFFSFNAYGHSPSSLAWLAKEQGFKLAGIVDFDVLDGVDEFLAACEIVKVRGSAGIETRVFVPEYATQEINSPGEPGVCYHMGIGFASSEVPEEVLPILSELGQRASQRNQAILSRVNAYLDPVSIDYQRDVLPLTPAGHPTERHMVLAYIQATERTVPNPVAFWAHKLTVAPDEVATIMADSPKFQNLIRAKLMKRGGVGYVQPESGMFPSLEAFHNLILACGALPCTAWLDGTTATEQAIDEWLAFAVDKGVVALNIIPDRNWNISDPQVKHLKVQNLYHVVELAAELDLSLNIGTEMNSFGQKLVDDLNAPELAPVRQAFRDGAHFVYGHTVMHRVLGRGYQSPWAQTNLPSRRQRNEFYTNIGYLVPPGNVGIARLRQLIPDMSPDELLSNVKDSRASRRTGTCMTGKPSCGSEIQCTS
jgi:hypothetical protein